MIDDVTKVSIVRNHLNISWDDTDTNKKVARIIEDAECKLNHKLGAEIDYFQPGAARALFLNYCDYAFNKIENEFEKAYKDEINELRRFYAVKGRRNEEKNTNI